MLKSEMVEMILDLEIPNTPLALEIRTKFWNKQPKAVVAARLDYITAPVGTEARATALRTYESAKEAAFQAEARRGDYRAAGGRRGLRGNR